jgi:hypothetical protein
MKRRAFVALPAAALAGSRLPAPAGFEEAPTAGVGFEGPAVVADNMPVFASPENR